jgi:hypothetical protein
MVRRPTLSRQHPVREPARRRGFAFDDKGNPIVQRTYVRMSLVIRLEPVRYPPTVIRSSLRAARAETIDPS